MAVVLKPLLITTEKQLNFWLEKHWDFKVTFRPRIQCLSIIVILQKIEIAFSKTPKSRASVDKNQTRFNRKLAGLSAKGGDILTNHKQASSSPFLQRYFQGNLWGSPVLEVAGSTKGKLTRYLLKLIREVPALWIEESRWTEAYLISTWDPPVEIHRSTYLRSTALHFTLQRKLYGCEGSKKRERAFCWLYV